MLIPLIANESLLVRYTIGVSTKKRSKVIKGLAADLKYCFGACVKRNRHLTAEELSKKLYKVLEHICDIHDVMLLGLTMSRQRKQIKSIMHHGSIG